MSVLLFDIVGFSKNTNNESMMEFVEKMHTAIDDLLTPDYYWNEDGKFRSMNDFVLIPTGDGYGVALAFTSGRAGTPSGSALRSAARPAAVPSPSPCK
jgi:hypothetical protein